MPLANTAEQTIFGNAHAVEDQLTSRAAPDAHLVFFGADGHADVAALDDKPRKFTAHLGKHRKYVGKSSICDPLFYTVQNPKFSVFSSRCLGCQSI